MRLRHGDPVMSTLRRGAARMVGGVLIPTKSSNPAPTSAWSRRPLIFGLLLVLGLVAEAPAGNLLIPNGNPTGAASANGAMGGSVTLMPMMAFETGQPQVGPGSDDDLLVAAMTAQGFTVTNFTNLQGNDLTL